MAKKVKGCDYAEADEKFNGKQVRKDEKTSSKQIGLAKAFKESEKDMGKSKRPGVKGQKKKGKVDLKKGKVI